MKFLNLVTPLSCCEIGEYFRLSKSQQIMQLVSKGMFYTCRPIGSNGTSEIEPNRNVHRKID